MRSTWNLSPTESEFRGRDLRDPVSSTSSPGVSNYKTLLRHTWTGEGTLPPSTSRCPSPQSSTSGGLEVDESLGVRVSGSADGGGTPVLVSLLVVPLKTRRVDVEQWN